MDNILGISNMKTATSRTSMILNIYNIFINMSVQISRERGERPLIRPLVDGAKLSSLGEKGKVRIVVAFVFSIVDQLLTRSLGLE